MECYTCIYQDKCDAKRLKNWKLIECNKNENEEIVVRLTEKGKMATENLDFNNTTKH